MKYLRRQRKGVAAVEFAVCAPLLLVVGFGFMNIGVMVQLKHNSKVIGHLAATELFKSTVKDSQTISSVEAHHEQLAIDLGMVGLDIAIEKHNSDVAVVKTRLPVADNTRIPIPFLTNRVLTTETYVFTQLQ